MANNIIYFDENLLQNLVLGWGGHKKKHQPVEEAADIHVNHQVANVKDTGRNRHIHSVSAKNGGQLNFGGDKGGNDEGADEIPLGGKGGRRGQ